MLALVMLKSDKEPASRSSMGLIRSADFVTVRRRQRSDEARSPSRVSLTSPVSVPGWIERQFRGALDAVHGRRLLRQLHKFPAIGRHQQSVIGLKISANFSKWREFIGWIEVKQGAEARMLDGGDQRRVSDVGWELNRENDVVKGADVGRHLRMSPNPVRS